MAGTTADSRDPQTTTMRPAAQGVAGWMWRTREAMAPLWCATGALACGATAHALPDHWWGALAPLSYGLTAAVRIGYDETRGFARTRAAKVFHGGVTAAFGVWMIPAAASGLNLDLVEFVGAGVVAFGGLWWLRSPLRRLRAWHRRRNTPAIEAKPVAELPAAFEPAAPDVVDQLIADWDEYIAGPNRPLSGVRLTDLEELRRGDLVYAIRATVLGVRGRHTTAGILALSEKVRSGLDLYTGTILMDGAGVTGSSARLTVYLGNNPLQELRDMPRPAAPVPFGANRPLTAPIGEFADAQVIRWTYYLPGDGAKHGIIAGDTGTGKGVTTDKIVVGAVATGQIVVLLLDPKDGRSSSVLPLIEPGGIASEAEERDRLLDGLLAEHRRRNAILAVTPWTDQYGHRRNTVPGTDPPSFFTPTPEMPLILAIFEEIATQTTQIPQPRPTRGKDAPAPKPPFGQRLGTAIREVRASGIAIVAVGQGVGVPELGGSTNRSNLAQNLAMLRTKNPLTGQRLGDGANAVSIKLDPARLFATWPGTTNPALGLFVPAGLCGSGRSEPGRIYPNGDIVRIVNELLARPDRARLTPEARRTLGLDDVADMRAARLQGRNPGPIHDHGPAEEPAGPAPVDEDTSTRDLIVTVLREADDPISAQEIIREMATRGRPVTPSNLGNHMAKLTKDGLAARLERGIYAATVEAELLDDADQLDDDLAAASY